MMHDGFSYRKITFILTISLNCYKVKLKKLVKVTNNISFIVKCCCNFMFHLIQMGHFKNKKNIS